MTDTNCDCSSSMKIVVACASALYDILISNKVSCLWDVKHQ